MRASWQCLNVAQNALAADLRQILTTCTHRCARAHSLLDHLSAVATIVGGIVRSKAFAAFRLSTSSNLVTCSTGRSAGLAPFKDLVHKICAAAIELALLPGISERWIGGIPEQRASRQRRQDFLENRQTLGAEN